MKALIMTEMIPQRCLIRGICRSIFVLSEIAERNAGMFATKNVPVLARNRDGQIVDMEMRWGLLPANYKGPPIGWTASTINARLETVAELPAFEHAWRLKRRVIIPVETHVQKVSTGANVFGGKPAAQKVIITRADGKPFGVAGIYDHAQTMDRPILSVASLTREPGPRMANVHDREPVVIDFENWRAWLDGADDLDLGTPWADDAFDLKSSK